MLRPRGNALEERLTVTGRGRRGGTALTSLRPGGQKESGTSDDPTW